MSAFGSRIVLEAESNCQFITVTLCNEVKLDVKSQPQPTISQNIIKDIKFVPIKKEPELLNPIPLPTPSNPKNANSKGKEIPKAKDPVIKGNV